jgi:lysyl-tRNA synthetase class 1
MSDAMNAKSWPFEQARALLKRVAGKKLVTFQTGFGPSGSPHIGTFGEIVRTDMVRNAFVELTNGEVETRLIIFSDDYDGLRKVPDGFPLSMNAYIDHPLSLIPDPNRVHDSFGASNNALLLEFIERIGLTNYEFHSATKCYMSGMFNDVLDRVYDDYDAIQDIMLPTLRAERRATYSPFLPLASDGRLLTDASVEMGLPLVQGLCGRAAIKYTEVGGDRCVVPASNGNTKLQWKVDWAARWFAFDVDYEMHGKDLTDSAILSSRIVKAMGGKPPMTFAYELFLDDNGEKISKSKGNGFTFDQWTQYSDTGSLALFMFNKPREAKTLSHTIVPRITDDFLKALATYPSLEGSPRLDSPIWHIFNGGKVLSPKSDVSYALLLNLATVSGAKDADSLMAYLEQYRALESVERGFWRVYAERAVAYTRDYLLTDRKMRPPTAFEAKAFLELARRFETMADGLDAEAYQFEVYEVGKTHDFQPLRGWFQSLYEVLFGSEQGPRFGSFTAAYGRENTIKLLKEAAGG